MITFVVEVAVSPTFVLEALIAVVMAIAASVVELPFATEAVVSVRLFTLNEIVPVAVEVAPAIGPTNIVPVATVIEVIFPLFESYRVMIEFAAGVFMVKECRTPGNELTIVPLDVVVLFLAK